LWLVVEVAVEMPIQQALVAVELEDIELTLHLP
jgi:hypothetical protein